MHARSILGSFLITSGALLLLVSCGPARSEFDEAQVQREVLGAFNQFHEHLNAGEFNQALAFYANDSRFRAYEDGELRYESWSQLAEVYAQLPNYGKGRFGYGEPAITVLGPDHAHLAVTFDTAFGDPGTDNYFQFEGLFTALMVRHSDGFVMLKIHSSTANPARQ